MSKRRKNPFEQPPRFSFKNDKFIELTEEAPESSPPVWTPPSADVVVHGDSLTVMNGDLGIKVGDRLEVTTGDGQKQKVEVSAIRGPTMNFLVVDEVEKKAPVRLRAADEDDDESVADQMTRERINQLEAAGYKEVHFDDEARQLRGLGLDVKYLFRAVFVHRDAMEEFNSYKPMLTPRPRPRPRLRDKYGNFFGVSTGRFASSPNYANSQRQVAKRIAYAQAYGASVHKLAASMQMPRQKLWGSLPAVTKYLASMAAGLPCSRPERSSAFSKTRTSRIEDENDDQTDREAKEDAGPAEHVPPARHSPGRSGAQRQGAGAHVRSESDGRSEAARKEGARVQEERQVVDG